MTSTYISPLASRITKQPAALPHAQRVRLMGNVYGMSHSDSTIKQQLLQLVIQHLATTRVADVEIHAETVQRPPLSRTATCAMTTTARNAPTTKRLLVRVVMEMRPSAQALPQVNAYVGTTYSARRIRARIRLSHAVLQDAANASKNSTGSTAQFAWPLSSSSQR
jgi:hypothetical protein